MGEEKKNDDYLVCLVGFCALMRGQEFPAPHYIEKKAGGFGIQIMNIEHIEYCLGLLDAERLWYLLQWCDEWKDHLNLSAKLTGLLGSARTRATMPYHTLTNAKK